MKEIAEKLSNFFIEKGLNQKEVALQLGTTSAYVNAIVNGRKTIGKKQATKLENLFGLSASWLLTGEGEMLTASNEENDPQPKISYTKGQPYYDVDFMAGFDVMVNDQTTLPKYNIDFAPYNHDGVLWCNVTGNSMQPLISSGDIIAIKRMLEWKDFILYGEVYGVVTNDLRTIKIVTKSSKGDEYVRLVPANPSSEYQPQDLPVKLITQMYKIVGCMHRF